MVVFLFKEGLVCGREMFMVCLIKVVFLGVIILVKYISVILVININCFIVGCYFIVKVKICVVFVIGESLDSFFVFFWL